MEKEYPYFDEELGYWFMSGDLKTITIDDVDTNRLFVLNTKLRKLIMSAIAGEVSNEPNPNELLALYDFIDLIVNTFGEVEGEEWHERAYNEDED